MKKRRKRKSKNLLNSKFFLGLILILVALLIFFIFVQWGKGIVLFKEVQNFEIVDGCSLIAGNILHEIPDSAVCKIRCDNFCEVMDLKYVDHDFITENRTCYLCDCNCK